MYIFALVGQNTHQKNNMKLIENILTAAAVCLPLAFVAIVLLSLPR